jgi:plastocyanin
MTTETPMATTTAMGNETPMTTTAMGNETPMATTAMGNETPMETETTLAGNATETPPGTPAALLTADENIAITDSGYAPAELTVPVGTTVAWINEASTSQTVSATGANGFFDSGMLQPGESYSYTFNGAGNYTYQSLTTGIEGEVIVTA